MRLLAITMLTAALALTLAADKPPPPLPYAEFHPAVRLLDRQGQSVFASGAPVSPTATCGKCHDAQYIAQHNYHAQTTAGLPLGADDWQRQLGFVPDLGATAATSLQAPAELNCFVCHLAEPDNAFRLGELQAGRAEWSATATLAGTGLVQWSGAAWQWNAVAVGADGSVTAAQLKLGPARSANCGLCHGLVSDAPAPLTLSFNLRDFSTETTGQVYSPQRISDSAVNLHEKESLARPWDVHAERLLECAGCHYAPNSPSYRREPDATRPEHLRYDPRKLDVGQYLKQPDHDFATGDSAQGLAGLAAAGSMRRCADCHDAEQSHGKWLPYVRRHLRMLACEACHIPLIYAPARAVTDWTMLMPNGEPLVEYRDDAAGLLGAADARRPEQLLSGYQPLLLPRRDSEGRQQLMPYNVITTWYWTSTAADSAHGAPTPLSREQLMHALLPDGKYAADIVAALDANGDSVLSDDELRLDSTAKVEAVARRLDASGIAQPKIAGQWAPYDLHHSVATGEWAVRKCAECHSRDSRLTKSLELSDYAPANVAPQLVAAASVIPAGHIKQLADGGLTYVPSDRSAGIYILGHDRWPLGDRIGLVAVILALLAAAGHGALRIVQHFRRGKREAQ